MAILFYKFIVKLCPGLKATRGVIRVRNCTADFCKRRKQIIWKLIC